MTAWQFRHGVVWQDTAGTAGRDTVRLGVARQAGTGASGFSTARLGEVWHGKTGTACRGAERHGTTWQDTDFLFVKREDIMRTLFIIIIAVLIVFCGIGAIPQKAEAHSGYWQVNGGLGLNLRTGPGGSYQRLYTMPNHRIVKAFGHSGNWMKLRDTVTGTIGWSSLTYLVPYSGASSGGGTSAPTSGGGSICLTNYWGVYVCSSDNVGNAIRYWAAQYGLGYWNLAATAACESDFLPGAYNPSSGVSGLFQFMPSTFYWQGGVNLWDVWDQSRVAAKMFANGLAYHWHCAQLLGIA